MEDTLTCSHATFSQVFGRQGQLMQATVQSLNSLNDQIAQFMVTRPCSLTDEDEAFMPGERDTLRKSMTLMRHLLVDAQVQPPSSQRGHSAGACSSNQNQNETTNNAEPRGRRRSPDR
ncbi:putative uncharacterized protein C1orf196 [Stegastes partitus]|uniref:Kazrin, periplakin interacting protein b n=1 Tax=Stegastes partitus TaxID=144197 RepID=A0A9Y4N903_9TELE|nr:PREDICTED: putative uncharacterized protein C1orf196 [Stegastes partitus]